MNLAAGWLRTWGPGLGVLLATAVSAVSLESAPDDPHLIAAVFPPWWSSARAFKAAASAGDVLGFGALPTTVVLHDPRAGLAARAARAGALFTVARSRRGLCIG